MKTTAASRLRKLAFLGLAAAVAMMMAIPAIAAPSLVPGNPTELSEYRVEDPVTKTYTFGDVTVEVTVYTVEGVGELFDFTSSAPVTRVVAKGGSEGAYVYEYEPPVMSDAGLHAPANPSGFWADLSWIGFSFGEEPPGEEPPGEEPPGEEPPGEEPPGEEPPGEEPPGEEPPGEEPPGEEPPGEEPPGEEPPGEEPPGEEPPGEEPPGEEPPGEEPPGEEPPGEEEEPFLPFTEEQEAVTTTVQEPYLPFTGAPQGLFLGAALAAMAGAALRKLGM